MIKKPLIIISIVFVVGIILSVSFVPSSMIPFTTQSHGSPHIGSGSPRDYTDAKTLVQKSDRIVVATFLEEKSHVVDRVNAYDGTVLGDITLVVQKFRNIEALKGDAAADNITYVVSEAADSLKWADGEKTTNEFERVPLSKSEDYVLFLRNIPARNEYEGEYKDEYEGGFWAYVGEPAIAVLQQGSGDFKFKVTDRYKRERDVLRDSNAPFELSKQEIVSIVSSGR